MLCAGCHDGTVALGDYVGSTKTGTKLPASSRVNVGTDLMNDHPVGKTAHYPQTASYFKPLTINTAGNSASVVSQDPVYKGTLPLATVVEQGTNTFVVSCKSCHNPTGIDYTPAQWDELRKAG